MISQLFKKPSPHPVLLPGAIAAFSSMLGFLCYVGAEETDDSVAARLLFGVGLATFSFIALGSTSVAVLNAFIGTGGKPEEPVKPGKPEEPVKPGKLEEPEEPVKPGKPEEPEEPEEPGENTPLISSLSPTK